MAAVRYWDERDQEYTERAPRGAYRRELCWTGRPQLPSCPAPLCLCSGPRFLLRRLSVDPGGAYPSLHLPSPGCRTGLTHLPASMLAPPTLYLPSLPGLPPPASLKASAPIPPAHRAAASLPFSQCLSPWGLCTLGPLPLLGPLPGMFFPTCSTTWLLLQAST